MVVSLGKADPFPSKHYPKPLEGEKIPIQVLDFKRMFAAWSPAIKKSLYFSEAPEAEGLKRLREIILLKVYDWFGEKEGLIELSEEEFEQFKQVYEEFLRQCGEIQFSREKVGRKFKKVFELKSSPYMIREVKKGVFSDKL